MAEKNALFAKAEREKEKIEDNLTEKKMKQKVLDLEKITLECGIAKQKAIGCGPSDPRTKQYRRLETLVKRKLEQVTNECKEKGLRHLLPESIVCPEDFWEEVPKEQEETKQVDLFTTEFDGSNSVKSRKKKKKGKKTEKAETDSFVESKVTSKEPEEKKTKGKKSHVKGRNKNEELVRDNPNWKEGNEVRKRNKISGKSEKDNKTETLEKTKNTGNKRKQEDENMGAFLTRGESGIEEGESPCGCRGACACLQNVAPTPKSGCNVTLTGTVNDLELLPPVPTHPIIYRYSPFVPPIETKIRSYKLTGPIEIKCGSVGFPEVPKTSLKVTIVNAVPEMNFPKTENEEWELLKMRYSALTGKDIESEEPKENSKGQVNLERNMTEMERDEEFDDLAYKVLPRNEVFAPERRGWVKTGKREKKSDLKSVKLDVHGRPRVGSKNAKTPKLDKYGLPILDDVPKLEVPCDVHKLDEFGLRNRHDETDKSDNHRGAENKSVDLDNDLRCSSTDGNVSFFSSYYCSRKLDKCGVETIREFSKFEENPSDFAKLDEYGLPSLSDVPILDVETGKSEGDGLKKVCCSQKKPVDFDNDISSSRRSRDEEGKFYEEEFPLLSSSYDQTVQFFEEINKKKFMRFFNPEWYRSRREIKKSIEILSESKKKVVKEKVAIEQEITFDEERLENLKGSIEYCKKSESAMKFVEERLTQGKNIDSAESNDSNESNDSTEREDLDISYRRPSPSPQTDFICALGGALMHNVSVNEYREEKRKEFERERNLARDSHFVRNVASRGRSRAVCSNGILGFLDVFNYVTDVQENTIYEGPKFDDAPPPRPPPPPPHPYCPNEQVGKSIGGIHMPYGDIYKSDTCWDKFN